MLGVGLMHGGSCWAGGVAEKRHLNRYMCQPPPLQLKKQRRGENKTPCKLGQLKKIDHWGTTLETKKNSNDKNQKNVVH